MSATGLLYFGVDCPLFDRVETVTRNVFAIFRNTACQRFPTLFLSLPVRPPPSSHTLSLLLRSPTPLLLLPVARNVLRYAAAPLFAPAAPLAWETKAAAATVVTASYVRYLGQKRERPTPGQGRHCAALRYEIAPILADSRLPLSRLFPERPARCRENSLRPRRFHPGLIQYVDVQILSSLLTSRHHFRQHRRSNEEIPANFTNRNNKPVFVIHSYFKIVLSNVLKC